MPISQGRYGEEMARLVHLNGPPGIGKSTLSALFADRNPGTLNVDVDALHRLVGGWQHEQTDTWPLVWSLVRAMAATHLDGGRDVVVPQYHGRLDEIAALEDLARIHGADFREIVLLDDQEAAIVRFNRRAKDSDDPWIRHHHRLIELSGGAAVLETMYANLIEVVRQRPGTAVVPSAAGAVEETYELLVVALREPVSGRPGST
jgi:predicted kinase